MRILQVTNTYYPELKFGGPPQKIHALSNRLAERGHAVSVLTFNSEDPGAGGAQTVDGVQVQYLCWRGWGLRQWPKDRARIADVIDQADVVHCYGLYNFLCPVAAKLAKEKGQPYLVEPLGMHQPRARNRWLKRVYHRWFTEPMFRGAARVVATSDLERDELKAIVPEEKLVVRRNGIDVERFERLPEGGAFRNRFGILPDEKVVLFIGRISPIKNLEQLIHAFHAAKLSGTRLVLAGPENETDYAARLRALVESLGPRRQVVFTGALFDADQLAALAAADLFVLPSVSESFGNAAGEAVAAGVPVLLTETCGIAPLINNRAGLAVPLGVESLANGLRVMTDAKQRQLHVERRAEVVRELSWGEPVMQTERLYEAVLRDGKNANVA